jgi:hypothetical protein
MYCRISIENFTPSTPIPNWKFGGKKLTPFYPVFSLLKEVEGWRCGSNGRVPTYQVQRTEFKPQCNQKKKKGSRA